MAFDIEWIEASEEGVTRRMNIPRCMSTQHPDNVNSPFFAQSTEMGGEDEIQEAYYAFSHLGCDEQMWDCEGKEVDNYVVKKLLSRYESFFATRRLGEDLFITLRVPNPTVEKSEAKILLETLESIPRSFDAAKLFYGDEKPPIFEVILPMTASARCIDRIYRYYADYVAGKQDRVFKQGDISIGEWIGDFNPKRINVIPLFEDMEHMLEAHDLTRMYLEDKDVSHQRVFLARSDPVMNYGLVSGVLMNKIALKNLHALSRRIGVAIHPIIGVGSAPFRGNLRPETVDRVASEYPSVHTFTIQSAFKYDNPPEQVRSSIDRLRERETGEPHDVDEARAREIADRYSKEYQRQVLALAPAINAAAKYVPSRRKRKLHIGLFGYSRDITGVALPRAISFTAALYSLGVPPELLGLNALSADDLAFVRSAYVNFDADLRDASAYLNPETGFLPRELESVAENVVGAVSAEPEHKDLTGDIAKAMRSDETKALNELVLRAAQVRRFLG